MKARLATAVLTIAIAGVSASAQSPEARHERHVAKQPAPVVQERSVASLSAEEIGGLMEGSGMGMALVAELNHYPGPRHVLDMAGALGLTPEQKRAAEEVFRRMNERAVALGMKIVEGEKALDEAFASGEIDREHLERGVAAVAALRGELRTAHLLAHLEMKAILKPEQIAAYETLRGR